MTTAPACLAADAPIAEIPGFLSPAEARDLYAVLRDVAVPSTLLYLALDALDAPGTAAALGAHLPDPLVRFVPGYLRRLLRAAPAEIRRRTHGAEIWTTTKVRSDERQVHLHVDCDEALRRETGTVRAPLLGSVLYLGPEAGLMGGETVFVTDDRLQARYAPYAFHDFAALAGEGEVRLVAHRPGKLALFAGHLAHGQAPVLDHPDGEPRVTFLANLWDAPIGGLPQGAP